MAPNHFLVLGAFLLLLVTIPITVQSKAFEFLQHLEGSHKGQTVEGLHDLKLYLEKFGYLNYGSEHDSKTTTTSNLNHANDNEFDELLESAVRAYQSNYHLKVTGILDSQTIQEMMQPRCGMPDVFNATSSMPGRKMKHPKLLDMVGQYSFFPGMPRWPRSKTRLTYSFRSGFQLQAAQLQVLRSVCSRAFKKWQDVSNFIFVEALQGATGDIVIGFYRRDHGDGYPFDGPNGVLAHAFAPTIGWFHYDADENWSTNPVRNQFDLESVTVHEIGHLLGLGHSTDPNAIMYPTVSPGTTKRDLNNDDIQGLRVLYS